MSLDCFLECGGHSMAAHGPLDTIMEEGEASDLLGPSIDVVSGISEDIANSWEAPGLTDELLDSILTGNGEQVVLGLEGGSEDGVCSSSSSDSGLLSPIHPGDSFDLVGSCGGLLDPSDEDEDEESLLAAVAVNPLQLKAVSPSPLEAGGHTTPTLTTKTLISSRTISLDDFASKKRRISNASSDSGVEESRPPSKYPALSLSPEEKRLCDREGIKLPSHYPLSREEEKNLKRIRRKIRNKESAQHSRRRKKEYVDSMEDRVRMCTDENNALKSKIELLEKQNKTLGGQLRRLHQIIINGGVKQNQTSTAMMVLLLSTALFLIPGFQKQSNNKTELEVSRAIKVPPMSTTGTSRSLLHFTPSKPEFDDISSQIKTEVVNHDEPPTNPRSILGKRSLPYMDHDYLSSSSSSIILSKTKKLNSYIEDDAPPRGYGPGMKAAAKVEDRRLNVNVSHGAIRTVVLHVPKDIK